MEEQKSGMDEEDDNTTGNTLVGSRSMGGQAEEGLNEGVTLRTILMDETSRKAYQVFLEGEFSSENLEFWTEVFHFQQTSQDKLRSLAHHIFQTYIRKNAPSQVNIPAQMVADVKQKLEISRVTQNFFDRPFAEVYRLMEKDSYRRFMSSPQGELMKLRLTSKDGILLQGFLYKRSRTVMKNQWMRYIPKREWQKRYCMLGVHSVIYTHSPPPEDQSMMHYLSSGVEWGEIVFEDITGVSDLGGVVVQGSKPHQFALEHNSGARYIFATTTVEKKYEWMEILHTLFRLKTSIAKSGTMDGSGNPFGGGGDDAYGWGGEDEDDAGIDETKNILDDDEDDEKTLEAQDLLAELYDEFAQFHISDMRKRLIDPLGAGVLRKCSRDDKSELVVVKSHGVHFWVTSAENMVGTMDRLKKDLVIKERFKVAAQLKLLARTVEEISTSLIEERESSKEKWDKLKKYMSQDKWVTLTHQVMSNSKSKEALMGACESTLRKLVNKFETQDDIREGLLGQMNTALFDASCTYCSEMISNKGVPSLIVVPPEGLKNEEDIEGGEEEEKSGKAKKQKGGSDDSSDDSDSDSDSDEDDDEALVEIRMEDIPCLAHLSCVMCSQCEKPAVSKLEFTCYFSGQNPLCGECYRRRESEQAPTKPTKINAKNMLPGYNQMSGPNASDVPDLESGGSFQNQQQQTPAPNNEEVEDEEVVQLDEVEGVLEEEKPETADDINIQITMPGFSLSSEKKNAPKRAVLQTNLRKDLSLQVTEDLRKDLSRDLFMEEVNKKLEDAENTVKDTEENRIQGEDMFSGEDVDSNEGEEDTDDDDLDEQMIIDVFESSSEEDSDEEEDDFEVVCARCDQSIAGSKCISALGQTWCPDHFMCSGCDNVISVGTPFFSKEDGVYCKNCYSSEFLPTCAKCQQTVETGDTVYSAFNECYHQDCFVCGDCEKVFDVGEKYFGFDGIPYCGGCFQQVFFIQLFELTFLLLIYYVDGLRILWDSH